MEIQRSYSGTIDDELNLSKSFIDCVLFLRQVLLRKTENMQIKNCSNCYYNQFHNVTKIH
jgi:hypothetical protein